MVLFRDGGSLHLTRDVLLLSRPAINCLARRVSGDPRPTDQSLGDPLARRPAAIDVRHFLQEPGVPAAGSSLALSPLSVREQEAQLECFSETDELELGGGRKRLLDVPTIEGSPEAHVGGALCSQEQMFP